MLELVVLQQQQQGLEHGNGEQAIGQDREQDMRQDPRLLIDQRYGAGRGELGQQGGHRAEREQQHEQVFDRDAQAGQQGQRDHRDGDQTGGAEEVEAKAQRGDQLEEQGATLGNDRKGTEQTEQPFVGAAALGQATALVESGGDVEAGGEQVGDEAGEESISPGRQALKGRSLA